MSSNNHNSATMERHLRKIHDCLNIGSNKKAVQEVDRLPKKVKDLTVFKALKSLAFIRMYKRQQAFEILNEINLENDLDELTLQTMTSCYKESVDVEKIVDLYESASRKKPNDPEILAHLFMAHVRVFNFKRQKEIAFQMYKMFTKKKRLYSFWAIMSLVMQAQELEVSASPDNPDRRVCLSLAEKMCEKMIDDERTHEEIELYLLILRKQNKYEEEYKFLTGPICLRITDHLSWFNRRRAYLCLNLRMYSRAFKHYFPTLIQEYPDQIDYYQGLFKSAFLLDTEAPSQQQPVAMNEPSAQSVPQTTGTPVKSTSALAECYDIVEKQCVLALEPVENNKDQKAKNQSRNLSRASSLNPNKKRLLRGPFMARIELYHCIVSNKSSLPQNVYNLCMNQFDANYPSLISLLLDFFQAFSKKTMCFYDMDYLINRTKLTDSQEIELLTAIETWEQDISKNQPDINVYDQYHIKLNYHMLKHFLHKYRTSDSKLDRLKICSGFINNYDANRHLGKSANRNEFQLVDNYCLLAINSIMTNCVSLRNFMDQTIITDSTLVSLIVMAENAINNSPSNHQLKLVLLKLYSFIGSSIQCSEVLLSLDIKHFQIDTLSHLLNPVLYNTGNYTLSKESLETCLEFYSQGIRECFESLTASYRDGRYSKIEEISKVLRKFSDSLNAVQCALLKGILSNVNASKFDDLFSASQSFDQLRGLQRLFGSKPCNYVINDNRDMKVLKSLNNETCELVQKRQLETLMDEKLWIKLRYHLIKSVYLQLENSKKALPKDGHIVDRSEIDFSQEQIESARSEIKKIIEEEISDERHSYLEPEALPFRWKHIKFDSLVELVTSLVFINNNRDIDVDDFNKHLDAIINDLEKQLISINSLVKMKQALLSLTITLEFFSMCVTSLISLNHLDHGSTGTNSDSNQVINTQVKVSSQSQSQPHTKVKSVVQQMINRFESQLTRLISFIKNVDPKVMIIDKIEELESVLLSQPEHTSFETKCGSSFNPLMNPETSKVIFLKVKEKLSDSYGESLREIENACRNKLKLLRSSG